MVSCSNDAFTESLKSGEDLTQSNINVMQIDTFSIKMSTFKYDSIVNNGDTRIVVGRYTDPYFGKVNASAYIDFVPATYTIDALAVFDSVVVSMKYDGFYYNDTLAQKTVKIQQLAKELRYKSDQAYFYNTSTIAASDAIIGQKTFRPRISNDSLTVTLDKAFGKNLFDKLQSRVINDTDQFLDYFKGLKISPDEAEDASIIGFDPTNSYIRMYYSFPDQISTTKLYVDLKYNSTLTPKYFSNIQSDRGSTPLAALTTQRNELKSSVLNNLAFIQSGTGITTKITFPSIRDLSLINGYDSDNGEIFKSKLKIKIDNKYTNKKLYASDSLYMYVVDQNNDFVTRLNNASGKAIMAYVDRQNSENNEVYLIAPVEVYLKRILTNSVYLKYGLVFLPKGFYSNTERIILNGENNSEYKSRLELTYVIYDK